MNIGVYLGYAPGGWRTDTEVRKDALNGQSQHSRQTVTVVVIAESRMLVAGVFQRSGRLEAIQTVAMPTVFAVWLQNKYARSFQEL